MTIFTQHVYRDKRLDEFRTTGGEVLGATLQETLETNPVASAVRAGEFANALYGEPLPDVGVSEFGMEIPRAAPDSPLVSFDDASARVKEQGLDLKHFDIPDSGIPERALDMLIKWRKEDQRRADIYARSPGGFSLGAAQLAVALGGSAVDPLNIAASFIPVAGPVRTAARLARTEGRLGRAAVRARVGAVEGAVGAAVVEPAVLASQQYTQSDYDIWDSVLNIALGTALGGGLHAGVGAASDAFARGVPVTRAEAAGAMAERIRQASPRARETALRTSIAQAASGRNIEVEPVLQMDAGYAAARFQRGDYAFGAYLTSVPTRTIDDTRGQGVQFHGTSTQLTALDPGQYSLLNYYGQGFYTTDAVDIAQGYSRKGKGPGRFLYEVEETPGLRLYDMEADYGELPPKLRNYIEREKDYGDDILGEAYDELKAEDKPFNLRELMDRARELPYPAYRIQEEFEAISEMLGDAGYSGMRHIGGLRTGKTPHDVKIYFRPDEDLTIKERAFEDFMPTRTQAQKDMQISYEPQNSRMADENAARQGDEELAAIPDDDAMPDETLEEVTEDVNRIAANLDAEETVRAALSELDELDTLAQEYGNAARALGQCQLSRGAA